MLPTAESRGAQSSSFTTALVTVVGGGAIFAPAAAIARNWSAFTSINRRRTASTAKTAPEVVRPERNRRKAIRPNQKTSALKAAMTTNIIAVLTRTKPTIAATNKTVKNIGHIQRVDRFCFRSRVVGLAMSCINAFTFGFEHEPPQISDYFELPLTTLG